MKNTILILLTLAAVTIGALADERIFAVVANDDGTFTASAILPDKTMSATLASPDAAQRKLIIDLRRELDAKMKLLPPDSGVGPAPTGSTNYPVAISNYVAAITSVDATLTQLGR